MELSKDQKYELVNWINGNDGKKLMKAFRMAAQTKKRKGSDSGK